MLTAVLVALGLALLAPALDRVAGRASGWLCGFVPATFCVWFAVQIGPVARGEAVITTLSWVPSLGIALSFRLDGLSLLFALLITGIGVLIFGYTGDYLSGDPRRGRLLAFLAFFMAAMLGTVLANNVVTLFVFWELTSVSSYLLIGFDHERAAARRAALQALLVTGLGGLALLAGLVLLAQIAGTWELSEMAGRAAATRADPRYPACVVLILLGAFTKSAQFPFMFWLPGAMEAPSPVSAYLHSSTMVKAGLYLVARLTPVLGGTVLWSGLVGGVGLTTMLLAALLALRQSDLKRILAFSTVSALGTIIWLLSDGSPAAVTAAMTFLLGHACYKATLFLVAGTVAHETGERNVQRLAGLRRALPMTAAAALLAGLSMAGAPPFFGFLGKELVFDIALHAASPVAVACALLTMTAFVAVGLQVGLGPFGGRRPAPLDGVHEGSVSLWIGALLLGGAGLLLGVIPGVAERLVAPAVVAVAEAPPPTSLALWHGLTPPLLMSGLALAGGGALFWRRRRRAILAGGVPEALAGEPLYDGGFGGLNRLARAQTRTLQSGYLRFYLATIVSGTVALTASMLWRHAWPDGATLTPVNPLEGWLAALILAAAGATLLARNRLGAVTMLGVVGYGVALLFGVNGAPDLAMTQFVIEALTVVLFVFVVYRLPRITLGSTNAARVRDAAVALSAGTLMTVLAWTAMQLQVAPSIAPFFVENSYLEAHGRNIVNVILVDFRALDTLGEISVLALAGAGVHALVRLHPGTAASSGKEEES